MRCRLYTADATMQIARDHRSFNEINCTLGIELESFSVMTAIAGSIANALERKMSCEFQISDVRAYLPSGAGLRTTLDRYAPDNAQETELAAAINALGARASFTRDIALAIETSAQTGPADPALVADPARRLASMCFVVRNIYERTCGRAPLEGARRVDQLLRQVSGGEASCLDASGKLRVPGWVERRANGRRHSTATAVIEWSGREMVAPVENASTMGIGVVAGESLPVGGTVVVTFEEGTARYARVIWQDGMRAGLVFNEPLGSSLLATLGRNPAGTRS